MIAFSRGASFDIVLTFPLTASLAGFFIYSESGADEKFKRWLSLFAFYFFIGVALLAKGLVGIVFPFAIVAFYYVLSLKFPPRDLFISIVWGTLVALAVASVWYVPVYMRNGWEFIDVFFIQHHFQRYTSNKYMHPQPFYFFFIVLPLMTFPWFPFFFVSLYKAVKNIFRRPILDNRSRLRIFAFAWMLVPLVFFTFSGSKLPGYILPSLPAAMILCGDAIFTFIGGSERRRSLLQATAFATFAVIVGLIIFALPHYAEMDSARSLIDAASKKGFTQERVAGFDTVSHSAEFYAAGRLIREPDGKQRNFSGAAEILEQMNNDGTQKILVITPTEKLPAFLENQFVRTELIKNNGRFAIVIAEK